MFGEMTFEKLIGYATYWEKDNLYTIHREDLIQKMGKWLGNKTFDKIVTFLFRTCDSDFIDLYHTEFYFDKTMVAITY